jgi:hypothetical protein
MIDNETPEKARWCAEITSLKDSMPFVFTCILVLTKGHNLHK